MNKLVMLVVVVLLGGCNAGIDQGEVEDVCTKVVQDGLAQCTAAAWDQCDSSYQVVLADLTKQNDDLKAEIAKLQNAVEIGCGTYVNGAVNDLLHSYQCNWNNGTGNWECSATSPLCTHAP